MKKIVLFICSVVSVLSFSQNYIPTFPTPAASALISSVETPTSLYTDTANINIPIYTINVDGHSFPINLSYATTGIKVSQEARCVGLGWGFNYGGRLLEQ